MLSRRVIRQSSNQEPMPSPRLLVIEGNSPASLSEHVAVGGTPAHQGYSNLLRELMPGSVVDTCHPGDTCATLPDGESLAGYDGIAITGSSLHLYNGGPEVMRQVDLVRAAMATGTPLFGSCWGLQVLTVAAGGSVRKNPKGREIGFGRGIRLTDAGRKHPMYAGKARRVQRADRASRRGRDASRRARPCSPPMRCRRCRARKSAPTARSPGACNIIRNIRCAKSPRSCGASARG